MLSVVLFAIMASGTAGDELVSLPPDRLAQFWTIDRSHAEDGIERREVPRDAVGCAAVSFVIEADGHTGSFRMLRAEPEGWWEKVSRKVVSNLRFEPTAANTQREPAFTYLTLSFVGFGNQVLGTHRASRIGVDDKLNERCAVRAMQRG